MIHPIKFDFYKSEFSRQLIKRKNVLNSKTTKLAFVSIPIVAHFTNKENKNLRETKIAKEIIKSKELHSSHHPVKDMTQKNTEALKKAGYSNNEITQKLNSKGEITDSKIKKELKSKHINFNGESENIEDQHSAELDTEITENPPQVYEADTDLEFIPETQIAEQFSEVAEMLENPVLQGVVAEILPGTRFLKPISDIKNGDVEKAAIGTASRATEFAIAPVKLAWATFGAIVGSVSWLSGNRGEGVGLIGGFKQASNMWARQRDKAENWVINREEKDPNAEHHKRLREYHEETDRILNRMKQKEKEDIDRIENEFRQQKTDAYNESIKAKESLKQATEQAERIRINAQQTIEKNSQHIKDSNEYLRQLIADKNEFIQTHRETVDRINQKIANARKERDEYLSEELKKQKALLQEEYNKILKDALGNLNYVIELSKKYDEMYRKVNHEGFGKIAGYDRTKQQITNMLGIPLLQNKENPDIKVPNAILAYGQKGSGKSVLGNSLAKQFDCYDGGSMLLKIGDDLNMDMLMKIAKKAQSDFSKTGKRTIIQIDEVEFFGNNQKTTFMQRFMERPANFADFLYDCADKFGVIIYATTNNPQKIDKSVFKEMKTLYVPPATKSDMAKILEHYVDGRAKEKINYIKLADLLEAKSKAAGGDAWTNARLENIVFTVITKNGCITQKNMEEEINNRVPDIRKAEIDFYKKES